MMRGIIARTAENPSDLKEIERGVVKFLYDMRLDYQSDVEAKRVLDLEEDESEKCKASFVLKGKTSLALRREIETGNDDGSEEWRVFLASENARVKKVICLPENLDDYHNAALKILMNHGGSENFVARIAIDDHVIKTYKRDIPRQKQWYEIPFEKQFFQGKSSINVYVRVSDVSYNGGNYLQIWGDLDTPTIHSSFNSHRTDDLSGDRGIQSGEYMIRLVLRK